MEIVSLEISKKLKEKGFREKCRESYRKGELISNKTAFNCDAITDIKMSYNTLSDKIYTVGVYTDIIDAPTISQVLKWLRAERKIYVEPCILADADTDADGKVINEYTYWSFSVTHIETGDGIYFEYERIDDKRFDSYEQAALAGIEYCLDNLI